MGEPAIDVVVSAFDSIIGTVFEARIAGTTTVGPHDAVIPEIPGRAWRPGINELVVRPDNPFPSGFRLA